MKKLVLLLVPFLFVLLLAGCSSKKTLSCNYNEQTMKVVYDKEKILEMYENGVKSSAEEVTSANSMIETMGGIESYIDFIESMVKLSGGSCKR